MNIPQLRRLPVTHDELKNINLHVPDALVNYPYKRQFDLEEYRLLKLGLIEEEIAYIEANQLYYFARSQPYIFRYRLQLYENNEGAAVEEFWQEPKFQSSYGDKEKTENELNSLFQRVFRHIRMREQPATLDVYRTKPDAMGEANTYPMVDAELTKKEFWKLVWGFIPRSMDDHWRSWFDFEAQILHVYWYWKPYHLYQIRFEESINGYKAVEVKIAKEFESEAFTPEHAKGIIQFFIRMCRYSIEEI